LASFLHIPGPPHNAPSAPCSPAPCPPKKETSRFPVASR
jgi:hypothetical protein